MKILYILFLIIYCYNLSSAQSLFPTLKIDEKYPLWLKDDNIQTDQTSGIAFLYSSCDSKFFLLADDIGKLHLLQIKNDTALIIKQITFSDSVSAFINSLPKADFEEVVYDKNENAVYLSIEGNGNDFKDHVGIYKLFFDKCSQEFSLINRIEKIEFKTESDFLKYTSYNLGYEGVAIDENYFYLGLEGFIKNKLFADSTILFVARKSDKKIIKEISTKEIGVQTICGLYSDNNFSVWGVDRNRRKIFHILFDKDFNIISFYDFECSLSIPGYNSLNYLPSIESITIDDENSVYTVDDPWREMFVPPQQVLNKLDNKTINNFKAHVPTIFKYKINYPQGEN